jgi:hypothetical protein
MSALKSNYNKKYLSEFISVNKVDRIYHEGHEIYENDYSLMRKANINNIEEKETRINTIDFTQIDSGNFDINLDCNNQKMCDELYITTKHILTK